MKDFTIGSMYWVNPKASFEDLREDLRRVQGNGLTLLRTFIGWEYAEPRKGQYDFAMYDRFFRAAEESGLQLMPTILFYLPFHLTRELLAKGIDDRARRFPCLDRPEVREPLARFIGETVTRYGQSPALRMWNIWNEPTDGICHCPHSTAAFAAYLRQKYRTWDELREAWAGEYGIFNPILPDSFEELNADFIQDALACASRSRDTAMQLDWFEFNMQHAAEHASWLIGEIRKHDPVHECHANPAQRANALTGGGVNGYLFGKVLDSISGSVHPHGHCANLKPTVRHSDILPMLTFIDRFRSWGQGKDSYIGEYQAGSTWQKTNAYTPRGRDHFATLSHALVRGLRGVIFWEWQSWRQSFFEVGEFSLRNPSDGGETERSQAVRRFAGLYRDHREFFRQAQMREPQAAIFESMDENALEAASASPAPGFTHAHALSAMLCHRALAAAGISAGFVSECLLTEEHLKRYRVLIVPQAQLVSEETAEALKTFVRNGGAVWADGRCGFMDRHTFLRRRVPGHGLDRMFGCREIDEVAPFPEDRLETADYGEIPPYRVLQRLEVYPGAETIASCNGIPAAVRGAFGKGQTEYWGTPLCWGDVQNGTDFADGVLTDFVRRCGVAPELEFSGKRCLVSCLRAGNRTLAAVTNDSAAETEFRVKTRDFRAPYEEWTRNARPAVSGDEAVWKIPAGETFFILGGNA